METDTEGEYEHEASVAEVSKPRDEEEDERWRAHGTFEREQARVNDRRAEWYSQTDVLTGKLPVVMGVAIAACVAVLRLIEWRTRPRPCKYIVMTCYAKRATS